MRILRVWDLPTRTFHWALVVLLIVAWLTGEDEDWIFVIHSFAGYGVIALVIFRLAWGVVGNRHARFWSFVRGPGQVWAHARALMRFSPPRFLGHNPLGGWMILALLGVAAAAAVTGLFVAEDEAAGPLASLVSHATAEALEEVHEALANILIALAVAHVVGVLADWLLTGDNLVRAMVTGRKQVPDSEAGEDAGDSRRWLALAILAGSLVAVWYLTRLG
jgi:cytochrome b